MLNGTIAPAIGSQISFSSSIHPTTLRRCRNAILCPPLLLPRSATDLGSCRCSPRASAAELILAENGKTQFSIVIAADASPSTQYAAQELHNFLKQISGADLPVVTDKTAPAAHEIILGANSRLKAIGAAIDLSRLGDEGYVIRTVGPNLFIAGSPLRGNLYGVYGLLEDHLGCRWFAPGISRIPKLARIGLGPIDETQIPALEYREPYTFDCRDGDWCARNRMNSSSARLEAPTRRTSPFCRRAVRPHLFETRFAAEVFCHTSRILFACGRQAAERLRTALLHERGRDTDLHRAGSCRHAGAAAGNRLFRVQNDTDQHCECPRCQALARQEGSQGVIRFISG